MSSELPSAGGKSVFSVFGFGSSHYSQDEDFNSPLETAPESFDASNSLTALTKKKKAQLNEEAVAAMSHETAHKVRTNLPDQSELVLQSFCQSNKKPASVQHAPFPPAHHSCVRRYSTSQEEADDVLNSTEVLTKFNNTLTQTAYRLTQVGGSSSNIYNSVARDSSGDLQTSTTMATSTPVLTRVQSSPHLCVIPSYLGSPQKESFLGSGIISQYMRRPQSQNDLLEVAEYKGGDASSNSTCDNKAVVLSSTLASDTPKVSEWNTTNFHSPQRSGFSILSKTRQFGAWLTKATEGEKVEVTKKDLNVLAPNSF